MAIAFNKARTRDALIKKLFDARIKAAKTEYTESVKNTSYEKQVVFFEGKVFNPLGLPSYQIKGMAEIQPDSVQGKALKRFSRLLDDRLKVQTFVNYLINFVGSEAEFNFVMYNKDSLRESPRKTVLVQFKEEQKDKIRFIQKMQLLNDIS